MEDSHFQTGWIGGVFRRRELSRREVLNALRSKNRRSQYLDLEAFRKASASATPEEKLRLLREMAEKQYGQVDGKQLERRRCAFDKRKGRLLRLYGLCCFVCGGQAYDRHHVIQLQNNGMNERANLVGLCEGCHARIHPWLAEMPAAQIADSGSGADVVH